MPRASANMPQVGIASVIQESVGVLAQEIRSAAISFNNSNLKPDFVFLGKQNDDAATYLRKLRLFKSSSNLTDEEILRYIPRTLKQNAEIWFQGFLEATNVTWVIFQEELINKFLPKDKQRAIVRQILNAKQMTSEGPIDFIYRVKALALQLVTPLDQETLLDSVLNGLTSDYKLAVDPSIQTTMDLLETRLGYLQGVFAEKSKFGQVPRTSQVNQNSSSRQSTDIFFSENQQALQPNHSGHSVNSQKNLHVPNFQDNTSNRYAGYSRPFCNLCKRAGHTANRCYNQGN